MGIGPRIWQTLGRKKTLRSRKTSSGQKMRGRKSSCLGGGNEKKERRKKPRWVRKDKDRSDGGQMGGRTQGQFFVDVQTTVRKLR
jgi:hypothetical protein